MGFTEDFGDFFVDEEFGITATFSGSNVVGIFEETFIVVHGIEGLHPVFTCALADVSGAAHGDAITIAGGSYKVVSVQKDGTGIVALVLEDQS